MARKQYRRIHIYMPPDLYTFFEASFFNPITGEFERGFSGLVQKLLRDERDRRVAAGELPRTLQDTINVAGTAKVPGVLEGLD